MQQKTSTDTPGTDRSQTLEGQVALVTGAARGLGFAIAAKLARHGARIVINDLDGDGLAEAVANLKAAGHEVHSFVGNVGVTAECRRMVDSTTEAFGKLNILVNNAGGSAYTALKLEDVTEEEYDRVMDWNVRSTFFVSQAALPALKASRGTIVNMSSISGRIGHVYWSPQYSAAKAAISGLTRNMAVHLGPDGIRVNAVAPAFIRSGARSDMIWEKRDTTQVLEQVPLRRRGEIEELADLVLFLAGPSASFMTGGVLDINGGFAAV